MCNNIFEILLQYQKIYLIRLEINKSTTYLKSKTYLVLFLTTEVLFLIKSSKKQNGTFNFCRNHKFLDT